jgi:hypothetical protein
VDQELATEDHCEDREDRQQEEVGEELPLRHGGAVLVADRLEHRRLPERPQGDAEPLGEEGDDEAELLRELVLTDVGAADEAGQQEHVGVLDREHRQRDRHPAEPSLDDQPHLLDVERGLEAADEEGDADERRDGGPDRAADDRALHALPLADEVGHGHEAERGP